MDGVRKRRSPLVSIRYDIHAEPIKQARMGNTTNVDNEDGAFGVSCDTTRQSPSRQS